MKAKRLGELYISFFKIGGLTFGGGLAMLPMLQREVVKKYGWCTEEELLDTVEKAILLFREQGQTGERFADTIARIGFEEVEKQLLANDILERKQEILDAKLHLVGGATC